MDCTNCERLSRGSEYDESEPFSSFCIGYRTGLILGKEKSLETVPSDVFVICTLIGAHSEDHGQHRFVYNIADFYLEFRTLFRGLLKAGLLERVIDRTLRTSPDEVTTAIKNALRKSKKSSIIDIGSKFIEFYCSCGDDFFREYNDNHGGNYYKPDDNDKIVFEIHRNLGHKILYRKMKRVKHSNADNPLWQQWGPYVYKD